MIEQSNASATLQNSCFVIFDVSAKITLNIWFLKLVHLTIIDAFTHNRMFAPRP